MLNSKELTSEQTISKLYQLNNAWCALYRRGGGRELGREGYRGREREGRDSGFLAVTSILIILAATPVSVLNRLSSHGT